MSVRTDQRRLSESTRSAADASKGTSPGALDAIRFVLELPPFTHGTLPPEDTFAIELWVRGFKVVPLGPDDVQHP